ncbi:MAG TPA: DUF3800 domain-containing protein [Candidatus Saccharimonadales bacterium]|nr:DUF3800 domain-containing protein [Candidatus Saccharimonadales bacterium]
MILSIDESGTHRQNGYSIVALICITDHDALYKLDQQIVALERSIGTTNFHWAYKGWPFRRDFVNGLAALDFSIRLIQLPNPVKLDQALAETLPYVIPEKRVERLFIDGKKHKQYVRTLKKILRDKNITAKKIKTVNDDAYPTIRIADAVAGVVRYYLDNPNKEAAKLYKAIESKIEFVHLQK